MDTDQWKSQIMAHVKSVISDVSEQSGNKSSWPLGTTRMTLNGAEMHHFHQALLTLQNWE